MFTTIGARAAAISGILNAIQMALADLQASATQDRNIFRHRVFRQDTALYLDKDIWHPYAARQGALPFAQGAKLANPELEVIAVGGDGDGLGMVPGHLVSAGRRNVDMVYIIFNNAVYGLTKGQAAPTLKLGMKTKSWREPNVNNSVNPIALTLVAGFTFLARGYS